MDIRTLIGAISACVAVSSPALAAVRTFTPIGGSGNWDVAANWTPAVVPTASDRVEILANKICYITSSYQAAADTINVGSGAEVYIDPGCKLTLDNDTPQQGEYDDSTIDGVIWIYSTASSVATLEFIGASHALSGSGRIEGKDHNWCKIRIANSITVTNNLAGSGQGMVGGITFEGWTTGTLAPGTIKNNGIIQAIEDSSGPFANPRDIVLSANLYLADTTTGKWKVESCFCNMSFHREALGLRGQFYLYSNFGFHFFANVKTCGMLVRDLGALSVYNGKTFKYATFSSNTGFCSNPGSGGNGTCGVPWVLSSNSTCGFCEN